jgi:hypothetical protein
MPSPGVTLWQENCELRRHVEKLDNRITDYGIALESVKWELRETQRERDFQQERVEEFKTKLELQPCGHPFVCRFGDTCLWCKSLDAQQKMLARIRDEAAAELKRIEKHGGCAGFAGRVLAMAGGEPCAAG